jgi:hypothetical protein
MQRRAVNQARPQRQPQPRTLGGGGQIKFGKANGDIVPDTSVGSVIIWDSSVSPPVVSNPVEQIDDVVFDYISDQKISDGKEVAITKVAGLNQWRILWAECETPSVMVYDDGGTPPATITPGNTVRLPLSETGIVQNPSLTVVGGNSLQALEPVTLAFEMSIRTDYVAAGNNQEITAACNCVIVSGTPTLLTIPMLDSFSSTRSGTFSKTHQLPSGSVVLNTGDTLAFDAANDISSTMDLDIPGYILSFESR